VAPGDLEEDISMEPAIETNLVDQMGSGKENKKDNKKSARDHQSKGDAITSAPSETSDQPMEGPAVDKELEI
jgi:hypothetical protein